MTTNGTTMTCEEVDEMLGAYALDALLPDELAAVQTHLAGCPEQAAAAAELRAVSQALYVDAGEMTPPAGLRSRIVAAVAAASEQPLPTPIPMRANEASTFTPRQKQRATGLTTWSRPAMAFGALAAGLVIAVAGLLAWNINLRSDDSSALVTAVRPLTENSGATAGFIVVFEDDEAAIVGESLPRLDASQAYQLWSLDDLGQAQSLGLMHYDKHGVPNATVTLDDGMDTATVAITVEPAAGSDQPTTDPLYTAEL